MPASELPIGSATITFLSGPLSGHTIPVALGTLTIGADASSDIIVEGDDVASCSVRFVAEDSTWRLETLAPSTTVTVGGRPVTQTVLWDGAVVHLGAHTRFVFAIELAEPRQAAPQPGEAPAPLPRVRSTSVPISAPISAPIAAPTATPRLAAGSGTPVSIHDTVVAARHSTSRQTGPNETEIAPLEPPEDVPYLEVASERGRHRYPLLGSSIDIGRSAANDIVCDDGVVSARHLRIVREGRDYVLIHPHPDRTKTLNGLLYHGQHIHGDEPFRLVLSPGDVFRIGNEDGTLVTFTFTRGTDKPQALPPVHPIRLEEPLLAIGRRPECAICLNHPQVSATHALLIRESGTYRIVDQNSTNGIYVNGERAHERVLAYGDEIRVGPYRLVYQTTILTQYDESKFVGIEAIGLQKTGANETILLNNISISVPPRAFVAIVGGSGAGKSTLMDALNGLRPAQGGTVTFNGQDLYGHRDVFSSQMGYVPQDDIVHKDLTVERALYYAAKLRLPNDFTDEQIRHRIDEVLDDVEIASRRTLMVKKLSGGQRKRLSIALELLSNPSVFFLDEPTSGLDPGLDRKMMMLLRRLADRGHTIMLVTHATNNISICDYVCFLAQGGRLVYFGPPDECKQYFGLTDFAEVYNNLEPTDADPNVPANAEARFKKSEPYQRYVAEPLGRGGWAATAMPHTSSAALGPAGTTPPALSRARATRGTALKQFGLLSRRQFELLRNDRSTLILLLLQAPVMALLVMLLIRASVGAGVFDQNKAVQCLPQIAQSVVTTTPTAQNPTGAVRLGINTPKGADPNAPVDCTKIKQLLSGDPKSQADAGMIQLAKQYTQRQGHGNVERALQNFIAPGSGLNALTTLFIVAFLAVLPGIINGVRLLVKESSIYRRERAVNLKIVPYVGSKFAVMGAFSVLQAVMLLLVVEAFEPFRAGIFMPVLLEVFISLVLCSLLGLALGLTISTFAQNEDSANTLITFVVIPELIFAGVEFPLKTAPLQVLGLLTPMRWIVAALGSTVGVHSDKVNGDALFGNDPTFHGTLFSTYSQTDAMHRLLLAWGVSGAIFLVLIVVICVGLKRQDVGHTSQLLLPGVLARRLRPPTPRATRQRSVPSPVTAASDGARREFT